MHHGRSQIERLGTRVLSWTLGLEAKGTRGWACLEKVVDFCPGGGQDLDEIEGRRINGARKEGSEGRREEREREVESIARLVGNTCARMKLARRNVVSDLRGITRHRAKRKALNKHETMERLDEHEPQENIDRNESIVTSMQNGALVLHLEEPDGAAS